MSKKKVFWISCFCFLLTVNIVSTIILFSSENKNWFHAKTKSLEEKVLSIAYGDLLNNGTFTKVVKLQTPNSVVLEFYSEVQNGSRYMISRVEIPNAKNGFFDYHGQAVQLAVVDLDGDGKMELLSPTFNNLMIAKLNPYQYHPELESFVPFQFSGKTRY